jgi:hypothetical protein
MFIAQAAAENSLAPEERNALFRKGRCFAPLELQVLVSRFYKHLVPPGLKTRAAED